MRGICNLKENKKDYQMKVTYIDHSGFLLEMEKICFLFDYYKGEIPVIDKDKALVVFVSHKHPDHYNAKIFDLLESHPNVFFILDKDCGVKWKIRECEEQGFDLKEKILRVRKNMQYNISLSNETEVTLTTLKSTDTGVAFLIQCEGKTIYHAGDLNLWSWKDESDHYNTEMEKNYRKELEKIKGCEIDVAFLPLDPRQREHSFLGMELFMDYTDCKKVFPMHFWNKFSICRKFVEKNTEAKEKIMCIEKKGQSFIL